MQQQYQLDDKTAINRIKELKKRLEKDLVILAHHYQSKDIVELADCVGDSLVLSRYAANQQDKKIIVFCGVMFMAQSAAVLVSDEQKVILPDLSAGCPLADMCDISYVEGAWKEISEVININGVIPISYINSDISLKSFTGLKGGAICTSSNAPAVIRWGLERKKKVFFFSDRYLGSNSANDLGLASDERVIWDPSKPLGGLSAEHLERAKLIIWNGYCHVHFRFSAEDVNAVKTKYPAAKIVVHSECRDDVVALSDGHGSTSYIISFVEDAKPGDVIAVGTEINLVNRLADRFTDRTVIPLSVSLCPNMFKISIQDLLVVLENLGGLNVIKVPDNMKKNARLALERMLEAG